ncbi:MAG: hypothetical protein ACR2MX_09395 [Cyclobacteriaceae bacterium]
MLPFYHTSYAGVMKYNVLHNLTVVVAFIGTVLILLEMIREVGWLQFSQPENLDYPGLVLVVVGAIGAAWSAKKMRNS